MQIDISTAAHPNVYVQVDPQDAHLFQGCKWTPDVRACGLTYAHRKPRGCGKLYLHRIIMQPAAGMVVDHIDRDGLNNRRANLRVVRPAVNNWNRRADTHSASKYKGVSCRGGQWVAQIANAGERYHLGRFDSEVEAALRYDAAAVALGLDRTGLNFPELPTAAHHPDRSRDANQWGFPGIRKTSDGRFGVRILKGGARYSIGSFVSPDAARAAAIAELAR